ncbi:uncharacterized protein LOC127261932 isoform X2 [Andrographis paniculata]|uniref:uncharacterized protein LOC127261929 isoform X2 n=1 Tax=Andrographis paniculata TaxID=175694 RepID=UPI0021E93C97|nr:uncharacterized protein LOC127261929 isoform X2 [Andrographis paniculata]XP_051146334.1 uncharacterized protein LOC127261932 isoform X2 [Andrographis paniculata]
MSDLYLSNQIPAPSDLESRASVFPYILNSYTFGFVLCFSGDYSGDRIEFQCCRKQAFARLPSAAFCSNCFLIYLTVDDE